MAACPSCHSSNPESHSYCGQCGAPLRVATCGECGAANSATQSFCGQCGASLPEPAAVSAVGSHGHGRGRTPDERKLATVLFADVVGFTSFAEREDHEVVARTVDAAFRQLGEVVEAHGGIVDKYMGDSLMALFGVPSAHDDDAERAVAAALAMRDMGGDLAFSIGVNSGEVTVTSLGREGSPTVIGDVVNVAARLEKAAGPGEVLCGRLTYELARDRVRFREHQPVPLKGKRHPVEVWVAEALLPAGSVAADGSPRLVGREDELGFLLSQWRRTVDDRQARIVLLSGDAGSGKSRLLAELARVAAIDGLVISASYPAYGTRAGSRLAGEIVSQLGPASDPLVSARVRSAAGDLDPALEAIDAADLEHEQLWAFVELVQEKAADRPVLLALDDMHRADERTLEIVHDVTDRLSGVAVQVVLAGRPEPAEWLGRFGDATSVRLAPLRRADASRLAAELVPDLVLAEETARFLADRAGGNPLYLRELLAMARNRGLFVEVGGRQLLSAHEEIPATLHAMLAARLDSLEPRQKVALQHVAVLGDSATADRVAVLGSPNAAAVLQALADAGLVVQRSGGYLDLADSLLREVAYETLPRNLRGDLHRLAADSAVGGEEKARHLERAAAYHSNDVELAREAAEALADEGEALARLSRTRDALRVLERAVALGCRRPSALVTLATVQSLRGGDEALATLELIADDPERPEVAVERDHTAANVLTFTDPASALARLAGIAKRWHDLGNPIKEAWAYSNAGVCHFNLSQMDEAAALLDRSLAMFESLGDESGVLAVSTFMCIVKPADQRVPGWLRRALQIADATGDRTRQLTTLLSLVWNGFFRTLGGSERDVEATEDLALRMAALADDLDARELKMQARSLLVMTARLSGRVDTAFERSGDLAGVLATGRHGDLWLGWAATFSAAVAHGAHGATPPLPPDDSPDPLAAMARLIIETELVLAGRAAEAIETLERPGHPDLGVMSNLGGLVRALALVLVGRHEEAIEWIELSAEAAEQLGSPTILMAADALRAEVRRDSSLLPPAPPLPHDGTPAGLADVLVLRARLACSEGDDAAALRIYTDAVRALAAPGLLTLPRAAERAAERAAQPGAGRSADRSGRESTPTW